MATTLALQLTKWLLDLAAKIVKAQVRLHNASVIQPGMSIIFVSNHFTRIETLLLPYLIHKHSGLAPRTLATAELFRGRIGEYLHSTGAVSTKDPDRDKTIIRALLRGDHPWVIFPEGAMIKDKRAVPVNGQFEIFDGLQKRPAHSGAAALALRTAFYRRKLRCVGVRADSEEMVRAIAQFDLDTLDEVLDRRTVIIPVNMTYFPIRARDNIFLRAASRLADDLSPRALDELSVEGTVLSQDTDIDVRFGEPIDIDPYLDLPEYAALTACGTNDLAALESNPRTVFHDVAKSITWRYMTAIYAMTTINFDHLAAGLIRRQPEGRPVNQHSYRERIFLCAQQMLQSRNTLHPALESQCQTLLDDEPHPALENVLDVAVSQGFLTTSPQGYRKVPRQLLPAPDFHTMPRKAAPDVIANEIAAAQAAKGILRPVAWAPDILVKTVLRRHLLQHDIREFEEDYARFYDPSQCKPPSVGRPFLLRPWRVRAGVVLAHGYMAAPLEVRALAEYLFRHGFAVYAVRLRGHGVSPADLAQRQWEDWYASFNRGYAIMRSLTDTVILGGFSTGGCLALLGAARKQDQVKAAFSICAPLYVRNYSIRLVPSIISLNTLLKRIGQGQYAWEYVENDPENKHINYTRNPLTGVRELTSVMNLTAESLPEVQAPTLVVQASKDTTVDPVSGPQIFERLGARNKQLVMFERERHGIINGEGSPEVFAQVEQFLSRTVRQEQAKRYWRFGRRLAEVLNTKVFS